MKLKPVDQQVVVVMGASSGIGREAAIAFAKRGAKVVVSGRSEDGLRSLVDEIGRGGGQAVPVVADVAESEQVRAVAEKAVQEFGRLDTWVHVAAVAIYAAFEQTSPEEFQRVIDVNLMGQVHGAMAALPHLRENGGALIHISSVEAKRSLPHHSAYASAKHGIDGFLEALRVELRHEGTPVSVTQIMPGSINTPLFDQALTRLGVKPTAPPPFYEPNVVTEAILYAAEHPARDVLAGGAAAGIIMGQRISPRLMDALLLRIGFSSQRTSEPKTEDAPNNLFAPLNSYNRIEGDYGDRARSRSYYTWLQQHPSIKRVLLLGSFAGIAAILRTRYR